MKTLRLFPLVLFLTAPVSAKGPSAQQVQTKALEILIQNAASITLEGDVYPQETLAGLLSNAMVPPTSTKATITNSCIFVSRDGIYECHLDIQLTHEEGFQSKTVIAYETFADAQEMPNRMLLQKVTVFRGH